MSGPCLVISRGVPSSLPPTRPPSLYGQTHRAWGPSVRGSGRERPFSLPPDLGSAIHRWMSFPFTLPLVAHLCVSGRGVGVEGGDTGISIDVNILATRQVYNLSIMQRLRRAQPLAERICVFRCCFETACFSAFEKKAHW